MATHIRTGSLPSQAMDGPLTLTALQTAVGGFVYFLELESGDLMVVNEASRDQIGILNNSASMLAGKRGPVFGDAVLCSTSEIA